MLDARPRARFGTATGCSPSRPARSPRPGTSSPCRSAPIRSSSSAARTARSGRSTTPAATAAAGCAPRSRARRRSSSAPTTSGPTSSTGACSTPATWARTSKPAKHGLRPVACRDAARDGLRLPRRQPAGRSTPWSRARARYLAPHRLGRGEGRLREHDRREGQLEAGDGEQPRVLSLRGRASVAVPDLPRPAGLHLDGRARQRRAGDRRALGEVRGRGAAVALPPAPEPPVALRPHPAARRGRELHPGRQGGGADQAAVDGALRRRGVAALLPLSRTAGTTSSATMRRSSASCRSAPPRPR